MKYVILAIYITSIIYIHFRGNERLKFFRQLFDHSSLLAPINGVMYLSSSLPLKPYLDTKAFPELSLLKEHWQEIREEAQALYENGHISASKQYDDIGFNSFFRRGWKRFYLKWYSKPMSSATALCPKTVALIERLPCVNAAMFTLLPKNSFLFKHRDPYAGSLRYHLGLITPNSVDCSIKVDGQSYVWRDGEDVLFDETYVHEAQNNTSHDRIILFCDIKRPLTNRLARALNWGFSQIVMRAASSRNVDTEKLGVINYLFGYLYNIRLVGKWLKKFNLYLYMMVKYTLYGGVIYALFFR